jgi:hypothetical protein
VSLLPSSPATGARDSKNDDIHITIPQSPKAGGKQGFI